MQSGLKWHKIAPLAGAFLVMAYVAYSISEGTTSRHSSFTPGMWFINAASLLLSAVVLLLLALTRIYRSNLAADQKSYQVADLFAYVSIGVCATVVMAFFDYASLSEASRILWYGSITFLSISLAYAFAFITKLLRNN